MKNHYIPRLLLRPFAHDDKINTFDFKKKEFSTKKLKNVFSENDLFEKELEEAFSHKLESQFGSILNNELLYKKNIEINRSENLLIRKFLMLSFLRNPILNTSWKEMVRRTQTQNHPTVKKMDYYCNHSSEFKELLDQGMPSKDTFISDLKTVMEIDSIEDIRQSLYPDKVSLFLEAAASLSLITTIAFWDCEDTGQEFILPKLPGISMMDQKGTGYKAKIIRSLRAKAIKNGTIGFLNGELSRLETGSSLYNDNFSMHPISPTRMIISFSPYFRAFFPIYNADHTEIMFDKLLNEQQFTKHFFRPMRLNLFEPCENHYNSFYRYNVKHLEAEEVMELNAIMLDMETEEFAFDSYESLKNSFQYYDNEYISAFPKKHNFSHME